MAEQVNRGECFRLKAGVHALVQNLCLVRAFLLESHDSILLRKSVMIN